MNPNLTFVNKHEVGTNSTIAKPNALKIKQKNLKLEGVLIIPSITKPILIPSPYESYPCESGYQTVPIWLYVQFYRKLLGSSPSQSSFFLFIMWTLKNTF